MVLRPPLSPLRIFKARNEPYVMQKSNLKKKNRFIDELTELPKGNPKVSIFQKYGRDTVLMRTIIKTLSVILTEHTLFQ